MLVQTLHPGRGRGRASRPSSRRRAAVPRTAPGSPSRSRTTWTSTSTPRSSPTRWRRSRPTATTSRSPRPRASAPTASTSSCRATTATEVPTRTTWSWRRSRTTPTCSTSSPTCPRARPRSRSRPIPTSRSWSASPPPRSPRRSAAALVGTIATRIVIDDDGNATDVFVQARPRDGRRRSTTCRDLPVGTVAKVPLGSVATVEEVSAQGSITRIDQSPAASITAEIASANTGKVSKDVQAEIDALVADGTIPDGVDVPARRRHPAAERGVRRPVRLDGRRRPGRLRRDGADVQLAHHPVHHPVHACRWRRSARSRRCTSPAARSASAPSSAS